jgi:ASCH domain
MRALLVRSPYIEMILDGNKTWEIRGARTNVRGTVGLIRSRSGTVVGVCDVVDCIGPLTAEQFRNNARKAGMAPDEAKLGHYINTFAWVIVNPPIMSSGSVAQRTGATRRQLGTILLTPLVRPKSQSWCDSGLVRFRE